jgi:hypothetical protein
MADGTSASSHSIILLQGVDRHLESSTRSHWSNRHHGRLQPEHRVRILFHQVWRRRQYRGTESDQFQLGLQITFARTEAPESIEDLRHILAR